MAAATPAPLAALLVFRESNGSDKNGRGLSWGVLRYGDHAVVGPAVERGSIIALQSFSTKLSSRKFLHRTDVGLQREAGWDLLWSETSLWHNNVSLPADVIEAITTGTNPRLIDNAINYVRCIISGHDGDKTVYTVPANIGSQDYLGDDIIIRV